MKPLRLLYTGCWLLVLSVVVPAAIAQDTPTYSPADASFTVPIPADWTNASTDTYAHFIDVNGTHIYFIRVEAPEVQAGITAALDILDPEFDVPPTSIDEAFLPKRVWTQNLYLPTSGVIAAAVALNQGEFVYVAYLRAPHAPAATAASTTFNELLIDLVLPGDITLSAIMPAAFDPAAMSPDLEAFINEALRDFNIPGAAVAIVQDGEVVYSQGFGVKAFGSTEAVDADTLFMIGSQTKSMTSLLMALLVDDEVLTWDQPVTDLLPTFALSNPEVTAKLRVRDLLNMSSGVPRFDLPLVLRSYTPVELIESLDEIRLVSNYGEAFNYCNQMVAAGGYLAALAAGAGYDDSLLTTYVQLLDDRIFTPLGMDRSTADFDLAAADPNRAEPHTVDIASMTLEVVPLDEERAVVSDAPAGVVWSSANEMAQYTLFQLARGVAPDGTRLVSEANLLETQTPAIDMGYGSAYGMGWIISDYLGQPSISHGGNTSGFSFDLSFLPQANVGVVILNNRTTAGNFNGAVSDYIYETLFGLPHENLELYQLYERQLVDLFQGALNGIHYGEFDPAAVQDWLGTYDYHVTLSLNADGEFYFDSDITDGVLRATTEPDVYMVEDALLRLRLTEGSKGKYFILTYLVDLDPNALKTLIAYQLPQ